MSYAIGALAIIGAFVTARVVILEIIWRMTRDQSGLSGRFGHWEKEK